MEARTVEFVFCTGTFPTIRKKIKGANLDELSLNIKRFVEGYSIDLGDIRYVRRLKISPSIPPGLELKLRPCYFGNSLLDDDYYG